MTLSKYYFKMADGFIEVSCSDIGVVTVKLGCQKIKNSIPQIKWQKELVILFKQYINGEKVCFKRIPLDLDKGTQFQKSVWDTARKIPFGKTLSYGEIAERIGRPKSARAVGNAMGKNPVPVIIPCHRVIASNGSLGGFSSGLEWKKVLLENEGINI